MMKKNSLSDYQEIGAQEAVGDADPHRLIQMLMDGALDRIARARGLMERRELSEKGEQISSAISIIGGLQESLDLENGGEIAKNLNFLYEHMSQRLLIANLKNEPEILDQVMGILKIIKSAWDGIREEALSIFAEQASKIKEIENV